jgi:para-aminobenzoate synthetase component 1
MDVLSQQGKAFFFLVDFLVEQVEVYLPKELDEKGILIDFRTYKNCDVKKTLTKKLELVPIVEDLASYKKGFDLVQNNLKYGNSYLANYTRKTEVKIQDSLDDFFYHSQAKYKVLYPEKFVFFSPETFIEIKDNTIFTHPMKGTIDAEIENAETLLRNDPKEKAEHYTVVDLLRNDLSMVANNVQVDYFQRIDLITTAQKNLLAMSSEISGTLKPEFQNKIGSILKQLLPAGSILGAPKEKTLEIIQEAEGYPRGFYTGVCGWYDGENLDSGVMIRFLEKENDKYFFKSGGGITHLSNLEDEYQEVKNKIYVPIY